MATTIQSTDLDFDTIKTRLKDYLKKQNEFNDYDFEAAGLSNLLDVLAYNTHFNGLIANFAINESFLNTAQLRSSIISHAEALGYVPRSYTSSQAKLNLSIFDYPIISKKMSCLFQLSVYQESSSSINILTMTNNSKKHSSIHYN